MASWKRIVALVALAVAAGAPPYYLYLRRAREAQARAARPWAVPRPFVRPPRPWRWPTEPDWVAQQVVRHVVSWALLAGASPSPVEVRVGRRPGDSDRYAPTTLDVEIRQQGVARTFVLTFSTHAWDPATYVDLARRLTGGPRGAPPAEDGAPAGFAEALEASDAASLRRADQALFPVLSRDPRSAARHGDAALLWAAHALAENQGFSADPRPFLIGVAAHLALESALRGAAPPPASVLAARSALDAVLVRQVDALAGVDDFGRVGHANAWATALRLYVTGDTREAQRDPRAPRLVRTAIVRALARTRTCGEALATARRLRLAPAADWTRAVLARCAPLEHSAALEGSLALELEDARRLVDAPPGDPTTTVQRLVAATTPGTIDPAPPDAVVPKATRAEAGLRHVGVALLDPVRVLSALGRPDRIAQFALDAEPLVSQLPHRAVLDVLLEWYVEPRRERPSPVACQRLARLVADRPDLLTDSAWGSASRCRLENLLGMVHPDDWVGQVLVAGTGMLRPGPWSVGPNCTGEVADSAHAQAPWALELTEPVLRRYQGDPPAALVLSTLERQIDFSLPAMSMALVNLHDEDEAAERISRSLCEADAERCAGWAEHLARLGRTDSAEALWKRALAAAQDEIALSNNLGGYVNLLLDRGRTAEALAVARRAARTYSYYGLFTQAFAFERLGRFDEAAREYSRITERYDDMDRENAFYLRYQQRHGGDRFVEQARRARAEVFPNGIQHRSLADFRREGYRGGVMMDAHNLWEALRRFGVRQGDYLVSLDGIVIQSAEQLSAAITFTDEPTLTAVVNRRPRPGEPTPQRGLVELAGSYTRWKYGPVPGVGSAR